MGWNSICGFSGPAAYFQPSPSSFVRVLPAIGPRPAVARLPVAALPMPAAVASFHCPAAPPLVFMPMVFCVGCGWTLTPARATLPRFLPRSDRRTRSPLSRWRAGGRST